MDFDFIIQYDEFPLFFCCCDYPYRKLIDSLYVHDCPFQKMIVLLYILLHGHPILGDFLAMLVSSNYSVPIKIFNFHCSYLVKRN